VSRVEVEPDGEVGVDRHDLTDDATGYHLLGLEDQRVGAHPDGFHGEDLPVPGGGQHLAGLGGVQSQRFLDQDGLSGRDRHQRLLAVEGVRGGHVHDVDLGILDHGPVAAMAAARPEARGEGSRAVGVTCGHGIQHVAAVTEVGSHRGRNAPGAQESPSNRTVGWNV
jgi:hypothetical protein